MWSVYCAVKLTDVISFRYSVYCLLPVVNLTRPNWDLSVLHTSENIARIYHDIRTQWSESEVACNFNCGNWRTSQGHRQSRTLQEL